MKALILPSSFNLGPDSGRQFRVEGVVDTDGDICVQIDADPDGGTSWINRMQAVALIAHLQQVFGLDDKAPANPYIRYED